MFLLQSVDFHFQAVVFLRQLITKVAKTMVVFLQGSYFPLRFVKVDSCLRQAVANVYVFLRQAVVLLLQDVETGRDGLERLVQLTRDISLK